MSKTRTYIVKNTANELLYDRVIVAPPAAAAVRHVFDGEHSIKAATANEVISTISEFVKPEYANAPSNE